MDSIGKWNLLSFILKDRAIIETYWELSNHQMPLRNVY